MLVYVDNEFKCHMVNDGTMTAVETELLDGMCKNFIEGFRLIPAGETWVREDGEVFVGEMITPFKDYNILRAYQAQYESMLAEQQDMKAALEELGVRVDG